MRYRNQQQRQVLLVLWIIPVHDFTTGRFLPPSLGSNRVFNFAFGVIGKFMAKRNKPLWESIFGDIPIGIANPDDEIMRRIGEAMTVLTPRKRFVLIQRYGLFGTEPHTLKEISEMMAVSRERVRQIEAKALRELRSPSCRWILLQERLKEWSPIEDMGLSSRAFNCLYNANVNTISELKNWLGLSEKRRKVKNMGLKTLHEIKSRLEEITKTGQLTTETK